MKPRGGDIVRIFFFLCVVMAISVSGCGSQNPSSGVGTDMPGQVVTPAGSVHEMVLIPSGVFVMGYNGGDQENQMPAHDVSLPAYYIDKYEVQNAQYSAFVATTSAQAPRYVNDATLNQPNQPVVGVTWAEARDYCAWAGLRLPTEAEWEKAARGTDERLYPWGNMLPDGMLANFADKNANLDWRELSVDDGYGFSAPVGNYITGASPYGVYDLSGNVWEWVSDWYDPNYYKSSSSENPKGPIEGVNRVIRGGSWYSRITALGATFRLFHEPGHGTLYVGFRCVRDP